MPRDKTPPVTGQLVFSFDNYRGNKYSNPLKNTII